MTSRRKNRETAQVDDLNDAPAGDEETETVENEQDSGEPEASQTAAQEGKDKVDVANLPRQGEQRLYPCSAGTHNAIINGKRHDMGAEIEGGMTRSQIYEHRRRGVPIHCPALDNL